MKKIRVPLFSEETDVANVGQWYLDEGDFVEEGEVIVDLKSSTEKFSVTAPCSGVLAEIYCERGEEVMIGDVLGVIEEDE